MFASLLWLSNWSRGRYFFCQSPPAWQENEDGSWHLRGPASVSTSLEQQVTQSGQHMCQTDDAWLDSWALSQRFLLQNGHMPAVCKKHKLLSDLLTLELTVLMCRIMGIAPYGSWSLAGMKTHQELQVPEQTWASSQQPCRAISNSKDWLW